MDEDSFIVNQMEEQPTGTPDDNREEMLLPAEVAARLRVNTSHVYRHADELGVYRVGKCLRFHWSTVLQRLKKK
ncbi:MAG: hypothetical protein ACR2IF_04385 [Terriglobales bacterium]